MDGGFFERFGSGLKENFDEDKIVAEKDKYATLSEAEILKIYQDTADQTQISYQELVSSLLELNVSTLNRVIRSTTQIIKINSITVYRLYLTKTIIFIKHAAASTTKNYPHLLF